MVGDMENKRKHLEFIQSVISRMAANTFLLKGWSVTLVSALFALSAVDRTRAFFIIAYLPVLVFWSLDAYYLSLERQFRALFDSVRVLDETQIDFAMNPQAFGSRKGNRWSDAFFARACLGFYLPLVAVMIAVMWLICLANG